MTAERVHVYEILEPAPRGGPGRAFRARVAEASGPLPAGSIVQIRVVSETEAGGPDVLADLCQEHATARKLTAPGLCTPVDFGVSVGPEGRRFWSACRWSDGRTLTEVLAGVAALPDPFVDSIAKQAADAMAAAHASGVRVVGLSTDTILVKEDASALVLDVAFGAAQAAARPRCGPTTPSLAGAAPEAIRSRDRADGRADLYSLGALLFRAMTGRWHRPDDAQALTCEPESFPAMRPSDVHPRMSLFLDELVFALLDPDPAKRIQSFAALVQVLDERRESAWWRSLNIAQESYVEERGLRERCASDVKPPPIPSPAPPPDSAWIASRRARGLRLCGARGGPLVAREEELRGLVDAAHRLKDRGGQVRLVQGVGGAGRTRLLDAMLDALAGDGEAEAPIVLAGEHRRLGIGRPMRAFSEAFTRLLAEDREVDAGQVAPLLGDAAAVAPAFASFLSGREPAEKTTALTREGISAAFTRALATLCDASPVVFVVENLQWADPEGLDLFAQVARLARDAPLLLVGTYEPVAKATPLARALSTLKTLDHVTTVKLEPFTEAETLQLVTSFVATDERSVAFARRVHAASQGLPLRAVETIRVLEGEGLLDRDEAGRRRAGDRVAAALLPDSERAIWERRLALLGAGERAMLTMAVVQGFAFDAQVARLALTLDATEAARALDGLAKAGLIVGDGQARRFACDSLFDHVHDSVDDAALESCHAATADAFLASRNPDGLPPSETFGILSYRVAWHYLLAGKSARGLLYVEPAMRHLRSTWRLGDAERLADLAARTLSLDESRSGDMIDMLCLRAEFLGGQGRRAEQRDLLDDALLRARSKEDVVREARVLLESARLRFIVDQIQGSLAEAREALAAAHRAGDDKLEAKCQALLGSIAFREARWQEARGHVQEMLEAARRRADLPTEAEALQTLGTISQGVGSFDHAEELHRTAMNIYRREGDLAREADALASLGDIAAASGDLVKAEGMLRRSLAIERAVGDAQGEARVLGRLGMVLQEGQRHAEARAIHFECLHVSRRLSARGNEAVALLNLATVEYVLGRLDDARAFYGDAMRVARELHEKRLMGYALTGLGEVSRQGGELETARGLFNRAVAQFRRSDDQGGLAAALLAAGRVEVFAGTAVHATALLAEARELAAARLAAYVGALALAYQALLSARRGAAEEALAAMAESGAMVEGLRASEAMRLELMFVHALIQRVIGRKVEADRRVLQAEAALMESTLDYSREDRERVFSTMSPYREILAGVAAARAAAKARECELSGTTPV